MGVSRTNGTGTAGDGKAELRLKGDAVSRGVAIGRVLLIYGSNRQFYRVDISDSEVNGEAKRFRSAISLALRQLTAIAKFSTAKSAASAGILDAQKLMLTDEIFLDEIEETIKSKLVNAEWAVKEVADSYSAKYKSLPDEQLRQRYIDVEDISERLLAALGGASHHETGRERNLVIAAQELRPSTLAEFTTRIPKAIITEHGGWTSHTFILARELNVPAVTGLKRLLRKARSGDTVVVDGYNGMAVLNPTPETLTNYEVAAAQFSAIDYGRSDVPSEPPKTLDGREITIRANLDIPVIYEKAAKLGARGIGLYRSEFLFNQYKGYPSENEQCEAYQAVADFAGNDGVRIRTFDLGVNQLFAHSNIKEKNPALGLRAVRLSISEDRQFRTQLRALLRAAAGGRKIDIIVPMVTGVAEIRSVKELLEHEKRLLEKNGVQVGEPGIGAMVEVPSAVLTIEELLDETDFICLGTNDLVQYLLAADRDNESVAGWFRTLHPAVIKALQTVVNACHAATKPLLVCGEMAGSPFYVPVLIGLGARELSMNVNSIPRVRRIISGIAFEEAKKLVDRIKKCRVATEAEQTLSTHISENWAHLFPVELVSRSPNESS
jgi:phosphoenolpyruvate-protein phosphotransferase (PTS system enzyme I)